MTIVAQLDHLHMTILGHLHQLPLRFMRYLHHPPFSITGQWIHHNGAIPKCSIGRDSKDKYHSRTYSVTYLRILLHLRLRPKLRPNLVAPNGLQNQPVPHMYVYNLQTIQEIHRHGTTMTIWVDQPIPSGPRALMIDTMTLQERCQYPMCMMG